MIMAPTTEDLTIRAGVPAAPISHGKNTREVISGDASRTVKAGGVPAAVDPATKVKAVRAAGGAAGAAAGNI